MYKKKKKKKKKTLLDALITKQNIIAKTSQKETRLFKNVIPKESTVPEHSVFLLRLQHSGIDIHVKTITFMKNISIFSKRHECFLNTNQHIFPEHLPPCFKHSWHYTCRNTQKTSNSNNLT